MSAPLILCYHAVASAWPGSSAVSEAALTRQLALLRRRGYEGFTLSALERRRRDGTLPGRSVAITFDDGYASVVRARELLANAGYPATVFVVTQFVDSGLPLRWAGIDHWLATRHASELRPLSWEELKSLRDDGWEIGSHTVTHPDLRSLDDDALMWELSASRVAIAARLGDCRVLAYPYGTADARVASAAATVGYYAACTLSISHRLDEWLCRPRTGIYDHDRGLRLRVKLSPAVRSLRRSAAGPRLETAVRRLVRPSAPPQSSVEGRPVGVG
jgi:peptidoglycan/xylan/chitin deacetylase (PgdA/CDA1 family)